MSPKITKGEVVTVDSTGHLFTVSSIGSKYLTIVEDPSRLIPFANVRRVQPEAAAPSGEKKAPATTRPLTPVQERIGKELAAKFGFVSAEEFGIEQRGRNSSSLTPFGRGEE